MARLRTIAVSAVLGLGGGIVAQPGPPPLRGMRYFERGRRLLFQSGKPARARAQFEHAAALFTDADKRPDWAGWSVCFIAVSYLRSARYAEALGVLDRAIERLESLKATPDRDAFFGQSLVFRAMCLRALGDLDGGVQSAERAFRLLTASGAKPGLAVLAHEELAKSLYLAGDYERASLTARRGLGASASVSAFQRANLIALRGVCALDLGRYDEAEGDFDAAIDVIAPHAGTAKPDDQLLRACGNRAVARALQGNTAGAFEDVERATVIAQRLYADRDDVEVARHLQKNGVILRMAGKTDRAVPLLERALSIFRAKLPPLHPDIGQCSLSLALANQSSGKVTRAAPLFDAAAASAEKFRPRDAHAWLGLAAGFMLDDRHDAARALQLFERSIALVDERRERAAALGSVERSQYVAQLGRHGVYTGAFRAALALGRTTEAVALLERGRARTLLDLLERASHDQLQALRQQAVASNDQELAARIDRLRRAASAAAKARKEKSFALAALESRGDLGDKAEALGAAARAAARAIDRDRRARRERSALLRDHLPVATAASATGVLARLPAESRLLMYAVTERGSWLAHGKAGGRTFAIDELHWPGGTPVTAGELARAVDAWVGFLSAAAGPSRGGSLSKRRRRAAEAKRALGHRLFRALMPSELWGELGSDGIVFIVPHGALHRLPFESLVCAQPKRGASSYWLSRGPSIAYAPSASVLDWCRERRQAQAAARSKADTIVALGDPIFTRSGAERLPSLPYSRREVVAIAETSTTQLPVRALLGEQACLSQLERALPAARVLHLATHQLLGSDGNPASNRLALTLPEQETPGDDGFLSLLDLLEHWRGRLNDCDLVVLSACETQASTLEHRYANLEGIQALPWGFHFAGCPSVIATLWRVDDQSTSELMASFYGALATRFGDKLRAFTAARRTLMKRYPSPHHWAPFVFLGDPR